MAELSSEEFEKWARAYEPGEVDSFRLERNQVGEYYDSELRSAWAAAKHFYAAASGEALRWIPESDHARSERLADECVFETGHDYFDGDTIAKRIVQALDEVQAAMRKELAVEIFADELTQIAMKVLSKKSKHEREECLRRLNEVNGFSPSTSR